MLLKLSDSAGVASFHLLPTKYRSSPLRIFSPLDENIQQASEKQGACLTKNTTHNGFLCKVWSDPDLNTDFEICGTVVCYKKYYLMLVGPNMVSLAFRATVTVQCTANAENHDVTKAITPAHPQWMLNANGFFCKIWSDPDLNMDFEICDTSTCYKIHYLMLVGPNLARVHCAKRLAMLQKARTSPVAARRSGASTGSGV